MRRLIAVLTIGWLLFSTFPVQVLADENTAAKSASGERGPKNPIASGHGFRHKLPPGAVIGSTAERRAAWQRLTPEQRRQVMASFEALIGPALRQEAARHRGPRKPKDRWVMPDRLGKKVRSVAPAEADGGPLALTDAATGRIWIEEPFPDPDPDPIDYPPVVSASAVPTSGAVPLTVQFYGSAYDPDGWITGYYWDFGDGGYSYDASPVHTYQAPGTYTAWLSVTDNVGYAGFAAVTVSVSPGSGYNQPPSVTATASPTSGNAPLTVTFNAQAADPDGYIASYFWDFGDGQSSSLASPTHTYQTANTYQATVTVTDNMGAMASSTVGILAKAAPSGPDADGDTLPDSFESALADAFTPVYHVSTGERAGTGFSLFGDYVPQTPVQTFSPVPPISHYRVTPLGFFYDAYGVRRSALQIDYFTLWNRDDGLDVGGDCWTFATILGGLVGFSLASALDGAGPHALDNERSAVLVAAPAPSGQHSTDPAAYSAYDFYTAAHENTFFDKSMYFAPSQPVPAGGHVNLAFSRSKHGTYGFNPDHYPLFPDWVIYATYIGIDTWYWWNYNPYDPYDWTYIQYLSFLFMADTLFFSCVVERFGEQGGTFAGTRINIGEVSQPTNGAGFIYDSRFIDKLTTPLWSVQ